MTKDKVTRCRYKAQADLQPTNIKALASLT